MSNEPNRGGPATYNPAGNVPHFPHPGPAPTSDPQSRPAPTQGITPLARNVAPSAPGGWPWQTPVSQPPSPGMPGK